ncbi:MAG: hypothetical protein OXI76_10145 [Gemmatimonadota bacterium]|nr:hypothetical protein [Gemmatimonadota bacterium]
MKLIIVLVAINIVLAIMLLAGCSGTGKDSGFDPTFVASFGELSAAGASGSSESGQPPRPR